MSKLNKLFGEMLSVL